MQTENEILVTPGGEDTVHISFYCKWTDRFLENLRSIMAAKRIAQNPIEEKEDEEAPQPVFECDGNTYVVRPEGFAPDKSAARFCYFQ